MNKLLKILALTTSFFIIATSISYAQISNISLNPKSSELSDTGNKSIDWLSSCVNQSGRLDVLMLVDSSGSLQSTDPNNLRADIFATSVAKLHSLSKEAEIRIQVAAWAHEYDILENWTSLNNLNSNELGLFIKSVRTGIAEANDGQATDWLLAIEGAKKELSKQKDLNPKNCQTIFWFTDGGIMTPLRDANGKWIGDAPVGELATLNLDAIGKLCGVDSTSTINYQNPLIPSLKSLGVTILGVLLKVNPDKVTSALMTYFPPLVEGSGEVDSTIFGGAGSQNLGCVKPAGENPAGGVSIEATSADALNQAIDSILCSLKNCVNANPLFVDGSVGFFEIEVSTNDQNFELIGPAGVVIRQGNPIAEWSANINVVAIPTGYFIRLISNEQSLGIWKMQKSDGKELSQPNDWSARVYSGLDIQVDKSTLTSAGNQEIKGKINQNNKANNLSAFQDGWKLTATHKNKAATENIEVDSNGEFVWTISTSGDQDKADLEFELSGLVSNTINPGSNPESYQYPNVKTSISMTIFGDSFPTINPLNPEISLMGDAPVKVQLQTKAAISGEDGEICLAKSSSDDESLAINYEAGCFQPGELIELSFKGPIDNGKDIYLPLIPVSFKNSSGEVVDLEIEPKVFWSPPVDAMKFIIWFLFLILMGIAGPLALLSFLNAQASKLYLKQLSRAQIPVLVTKSSDFISVQRLQEDSDQLDNQQGFIFEDYQPLPASLNRERTYLSGIETLKGIFPLNPFGAISASASVPAGKSLISNIAVGPKNSNGTLTAATVNPNGLLLLMIDNSNLQQILYPNPNNQEIISATLISYSNLFMGGNSVIDQTNQDLQIGNSWMSNLLSIELPQVIAPPGTEIIETDDPGGTWDNPSKEIGSTTTTTTDADTTWGETSTDWGSSGTDDWGNDSNNDSSGWR